MKTPRRSRACRALLAALALAFLLPSAAFAHPLAPALLQLEEREDGLVDVLWKRSSLSVPGSNIEPVLPPACPATTPARFEEQGVAVLVRWTIDCGTAGLIGQPVRVDGLGVKLSETPWEITRGGPVLGQHNDEVFTEVLGLSAGEVAELREGGVI